MKENRGFTLVEILAVIVVLALIMIFAIPAILNIVNQSKKKAFEEYTDKVVIEAEKQYIKDEVDGNSDDIKTYDVKTNLELADTGKYSGFVTIKKIGDTIKEFVTLTDGENTVVGYNYSDKKDKNGIIKNIIDAIEKVKDVSQEELTKEYIEEKAKEESNNSILTGYSGQLHVCGSNLCDKSNRLVRIKGVSNGGLGGENDFNNPFHGEINNESLATIKSWGANGLRLFITANIKWMASYIGHEDAYINGMKVGIDAAIKNDMYVIVNWDPASNDANPLTEKCKEALTRIASLYPNDPHVMFEIWNEPQIQNTWQDCKNHASVIIPAIRAISPDAVIFVGSPGASQDLTIPANDPLNYSNIMYSHHLYMRSITAKTTYGLKYALDKKLPVFVTEWGPEGNGSGAVEIIKPHVYRFINLLNQYKLSYMFFGFGSSTFNGGDRYGIATRGTWRNDLPDSILNETGFLLKDVLAEKHFDVKDSLLIENREDESTETYRASEWRDKIVSINFVKGGSIPGNAVKKWDLSALQDNSVIGYLTSAGGDTYNLTISCEGIIYAPKISKYLFSDMKNLKSINFGNFNTENVEMIAGMFQGDESLESLDLSGWNTSKIYSMWGTFRECKNLKSINFSNWNPHITEMFNAFTNCFKLESLDMSGFDVSGVTDFNGLFVNDAALTSLNISTWNPSTVTKMDSMFSNVRNLSYLDIRNMNITSSTSANNVINNFKSGATIIVKNSDAVNKLNQSNNNGVTIKTN